MRTSRPGRRVVAIVVSVVVVIAAAVVAIVVWPRSATSNASDSGSSSTAPAASVVDPPVVVPDPKIHPLAVGAGKVPVAAKVAARLAGPLTNPALAQFKGIVVDGATGKVLWQQGQNDQVLPASSLKLLTGTALLTSMDPNTRLTTTVVAGTQPGTIYFVGGGDPTLSAAAAGVQTVYPGAPTVANLAAQIKATGVSVTHIYTDTSLWSGPEMANGWQNIDISGGFITPMESLMVDGDRADPSAVVSKRSGHPALVAGQALARALGNPNIPVTTGGKAPAGAKVLAQVQSQPVSILLGQAMVNSDNVLAEALGRAVAIKRGAPASFDGVQAAIVQALQDLKLNTSGLVMFDASGLSDQDKVTTALFSQVVSMAVSGKYPALQSLLSGMPVAGVSGTLADRFNTPASKMGAGWVRAKTGSVDVTYALVGYVPDVDGRIIVFAFNSNGVTGVKSRQAQDAVAASLRLCGCS